ncbi:MAG: radical SAM family heme chaperone HemW [Halanaerobium sp.]|nr:radical SAM family heme chaperone HemW [Halanaerobium sp.]
MEERLNPALYLHVPFCLKRCNYCNFLSYPYDSRMAQSYLRSLQEELRLYREKFGVQSLRTIYFGGGTPSCLGDSILEIIKSIRSLFPLEDGAELTLEVNPGSIDLACLKSFRKAGINRLSIGAQTFTHDLLRFLGRIHGPQETIQTFLQAKEAGFTNISLDLIYAIPGQVLSDLARDLEQVYRLTPEHLSLYNLKIEPDTPLARQMERGKFSHFGEDREAEMFAYAIEDLEKHGYCHYEISSFCRQGREGKHNLVYWNFEPYWGLGPGSSGYTGKYLYQNINDLAGYESSLLNGSLPISEKNPLTRAEQISYYIILGLRKLAGIDLVSFQKRFGQDFASIFSREEEELKVRGLLQREGKTLRLSKRGIFLANDVWEKFI